LPSSRRGAIVAACDRSGIDEQQMERLGSTRVLVVANRTAMMFERRALTGSGRGFEGPA
jgi:hypothetical protein